MKVWMYWFMWMGVSAVLAIVLNQSLSGRAAFQAMDLEAERKKILPVEEKSVIEASVANNQFLLPGKTTHGHYQIELKCAVCHITNEDGWGDVKQSACMDCHEEELDRVDDSHPMIKFKAVSEGPLLKKLSPALHRKNLSTEYCITCHTEHNQETTQTHPMGLTIPQDYCLACHEDIYENRPTHLGFGFETCSNAGCHNYHDNSALYEKFLVDHLNDPDMLPEDEQRMPLKDYADRYIKSILKDGGKIQALTLEDASHKTDTTGNPFDSKIMMDWAKSNHAKVGVNCRDCHMVTPDGLVESDQGFKKAIAEGQKAVWMDKPPVLICQSCHENETEGFLASRHGMRVSEGLSPMTPDQARLPFKLDAAHAMVSCSSCHNAHEEDVNFAAVTACLQCHDDEHSRNYLDSPHHKLWQAEISGKSEPGSGVSCATCHLPRIKTSKFGETWVSVAHNQNDFLRPNEKMVRSSCQHCHGVEFTLDALADEALIKSNFDESPGIHVESFDFIRKKREALRKAGRLK